MHLLKVVSCGVLDCDIMYYYIKNVGNPLQDNISQPRWSQSAFSPPWKPQVSLKVVSWTKIHYTNIGAVSPCYYRQIGSVCGVNNDFLQIPIYVFVYPI